MKVFCDLDGVLVDFELGVWKVRSALIAIGGDFKSITTEQVKNNIPTHTPTREEIRLMMQNLSIGALWGTVGKYGDNFWTDLEWANDGKELWNHITPYKPTILTGTSMDKRCAPEKRVWCARELGDHVDVITCFAREKLQYSGPNTLLIDDKEKNCQQWASKGGAFILHTDTASTLDQLKMFDLE